MQPFAIDAATFVVMMQVVALLVLVAIGLAVDAYWPRKRAALLNTGAYARPVARIGRPTLAAWHRAAWRRANPRVTVALVRG